MKNSKDSQERHKRRSLQVFPGSRLEILEVFDAVKGKRKREFAVCRCSCGNIKTVSIDSVKNGNTKSCGCLASEMATQKGIASTRHGYARHVRHRNSSWRAWESMRGRCNNSRAQYFKHYGGRGITVSEDWNTFENFLRDMGERPENTSLDRIDVNGNYEKGNCRWATAKEQMRNRRNNRMVTFNGVLVTVAELAEKANMPYGTMHTRICSLGWSVEDAVKPQGRYKTFLFNGENLTTAEIAKKTGVSRSLIHDRVVKGGWSVEDAVTVVKKTCVPFVQEE